MPQTEIPRRSLADVTALYVLEPTLLDIYVEGTDDKVMLEYVLDNPDVHVIDINSINLPAAILGQFGLTPGNRDSVIALAAILERDLDPHIEGVRCIVDDDFDRFLGLTVPGSRYLIKTDYCCLESYWYGQAELEKYRKLGLHDKGPLDKVDLHQVLDATIRECFLLRAAALTLGISLAWLDPTTLCTRSAAGVVFKREEFIKRWLNKNSAASERERLLAECERLRPMLAADSRDCMHGKDFILLLRWYIRPYVGTTELSAKDVVPRMLACCLERATLREYPMLSRLAALAGSAGAA